MDAHDNPPIPDPTMITSYESDGVFDLFDDDVVVASDIFDAVDVVAETIVWMDVFRTEDLVVVFVVCVVVNASFAEIIDATTTTKIRNDN